MLLNTSRRHSVFSSEVDPIHNYYEALVLEEIVRTSERAKIDINFTGDVACVALNNLPPRYIRHNVDMTFFMSPMELQEIEQKTKNAVQRAIAYVTRREAERQEANAEDNQGIDNTTTTD